MDIHFPNDKIEPASGVRIGIVFLEDIIFPLGKVEKWLIPSNIDSNTMCIELLGFMNLPKRIRTHLSRNKLRRLIDVAHPCHNLGSKICGKMWSLEITSRTRLGAQSKKSLANFLLDLGLVPVLKL